MNAAQSLPPADRTRRILEDLEAVRENLLALSDDIGKISSSSWMSVRGCLYSYGQFRH